VYRAVETQTQRDAPRPKYYAWGQPSLRKVPPEFSVCGAYASFQCGRGVAQRRFVFSASLSITHYPSFFLRVLPCAADRPFSSSSPIAGLSENPERKMFAFFAASFISWLPSSTLVRRADPSFFAFAHDHSFRLVPSYVSSAGGPKGLTVYHFSHFYLRLDHRFC